MRRLAFLLGCALAAASIAAPSPAAAQPADWGVTRDPFDKGVIAKYKAILARNPHDATALAKLLDMYRRYRTVDLLADEYAKLLEKKPDDVNAMIVLGRLHRMTGDDVRALAMWTTAVGKRDADAPTWILIGEAHKAAGKGAEARAAYDKALAHASAKDMKKKALRALADLALATNDVDGANTYFKQFLDLDPKNAQLWIERGDAMFVAKKLDVALESFAAAEKLLGGDPARRVEVVSRRGQALEAMGKDDDAVAEYRRAIKLSPKGYYLEVELTQRVIGIYRHKSALPTLLAEYEKSWPEGRRGHFEWDTLGKLYKETGAQDKAIQALKKAVSKAPWELGTQRELIGLLETAGKDNEALAQYEAVVRAAPGDASFQLELAERYLRRAQEKKGLDTLARLRNRFPNDAGVLSAIADMYQRWGKEDLAIAEYERLAKLEPDDAAHLVTLGEQYWQKGDATSKARAEATWKRLTASGKASGYAKYGEVLAEHNKPTEALANFAKAIQLDDKKPELYKSRAGVYESMKRYAEAIVDWDKALSLIGTKPTDRMARKDVRRHLVSVLVRAGGIEHKKKAWIQKFADGDIEAGYFLAEVYTKPNHQQKGEPLGTLEKLREKVPDDHDLLTELVKEYRRVRKYDEAVALLLDLAKRVPTRERDVYWQVSEIKREARKDAEAMEWQQKALAKSPGDPQAYERLAEGFVEMQKFDDAIAAYEKAIALDPRNARSQFALAQLYVQSGTPMKAAELLRNVLRNANDDDVIGRAGREAIDLEEMTDTLGELEKVVSPLSFMMAHKPVYRHVLVELYLRYVPRLVDRERHGTPEVKKAARAELGRIGGHGLQPLLEALRDEKDTTQQRVAVAVLGHLGNKGAAQPLVRMAKQEPAKDAPRLVGTIAENVDREVRVAALIAAGRLGDPSVLSDVLPLVEHPEVTMREAAAFTLGRSGERRAVPALIKALSDRRGSVQTVACLALGQIDDARVGPALSATLADARRDDATRAACAYSIGARKLTSGTAALLAALTDNRGEAQRVAAWALGQLGDSKALGPLIRAYFTRAGRGDAELVWAIGRTSGPGVPAIQSFEFAAYPQRGDKYDAAEAIAQLPGPLPQPAIGPAISPRVVVDHDAEIARGLTDALGEHRDVVVSVLTDLDSADGQLALGALSPSGSDGKAAAALATIGQAIAPAVATHLTSDDAKVRALAISVLAKLDGGKVRTADAAIAKALGDPADQVRAAAMNAVATLALRRGSPPPELVASVAKTLSSGEWADRRVAAFALGRLGPRGDAPALIKAAGDASSFVREAVATALGGIGTSPSLDAVLQLSRDEVPQVRAAAARSLARSSDERAARRRGELGADPDPAVRAAAGGV
ncbi:MAG TPA: HEAT repeat domain-containing protein [Kofleriaceae bacterium]|nr:HEAT repeat domain-containing protein [Kofleriaceae bacterium]